MPFCFPPTETLSSLLDETCFSDQTISIGEESIKVNKSILALHSTYFRSLWYMDFAEIDFSHLPIITTTFFSFIKSFYGKSFILTEHNVYHFYYLAHYFQVDKLIQHVENHLNTHLVTWTWLKPFIKAADSAIDLRAKNFVGPFFPKIDDLLIDDVMVITTEGLKILSKYCTSTQSLTWFINSIVESILNQKFELDELLNILNSCAIEALSFQQWDECLLVPLKNVEELKADLMKFLYTKLKNLYPDCFVNDNLELNEPISTATPALIAKNSTIVECKSKPQNKSVVPQTPSENQTDHQSKVIKISKSRKHSEFKISADSTKVVVSGSGNKNRHLLGKDPLTPGNVYTWKLKYQGNSRNLDVGVIDESKFSVDGRCYTCAHCFRNNVGYLYGCLSGRQEQWNPGELLEINVNLINYSLTIKSVGNSSIYLTGRLPKLSDGNYYPYACLYNKNHQLEIIQ
ncbi:hypothetical protein GEMRC1_014040 [Eukaryota sp. GEM-RC1]